MFNVHKQKPFTENHESLIVGLFDKPVKFEEKLSELDGAFSGELTELVKSGDLSARKEKITKIHTFGKLPSKRAFFIGIGKEKECTFEDIREVFGAIFKTIQKDKLGRSSCLFRFLYDRKD